MKTQPHDTVQLELRHLAPYLPYGMKYQWEYFGEKHVNIVHTIGILDFQSGKPIGVNNSMALDKIKPILRPMSDLTKEIEHGGERFVPMVELYKIARGRYKDSKVKYYSTISNNQIIVEQEGFYNYLFSFFKSEADERLGNCHNFKLYAKSLTNEDKGIVEIKCADLLFQKLYEWHFDLNGLIPAGLAIDVNTLNK